MQNLNFTIYDALAGVGGTWYTNRYPVSSSKLLNMANRITIFCLLGSQVRHSITRGELLRHKYVKSPIMTTHCPVSTYFRISRESDICRASVRGLLEDRFKTNWSAFYATGDEIQKNLERIVDKYQLRPFIKLQHRVTVARYSEETGKWHLTIRRPRTSANEGSVPKDEWEEFHDTADILFNGVGSLSRWTWPDIPGLETFSGQVVHSADWNIRQDKEYLSDKKVGVIGVVSYNSP